MALVVEDIVDLGSDVRVHLEQKGYAVQQFEEFRPLLKWLKQNPSHEVSVLVSDLYDSKYSGSSLYLKNDVADAMLRVEDIESFHRQYPDVLIVIFSLAANLATTPEGAPEIKKIFDKLERIGIPVAHIIPKLGRNQEGFPAGFKLLDQVIPSKKGS